jgi:hypothetical protein
MRLLLFLLLALSLSVSAQPAPEPLKLPRAERPPVLEDFISGRPAGLRVSDFRQYTPGDGVPVSQPTTAYLSYDDKNLYVGWICKDDPKKIRARVARRKDLESDDRVTINIDTFHDHKRAYWFDVNPYAIQYDGITTDGLGDDASWETLWYTDARILKDGYVVLQTIPFRSLRFPDSAAQTWGVMLGRFITRNNEFAMWPAVTRRRAPQFVGQFGTMEIADDISPGRNVQFIPYGLFSNSRFLDLAKGFQIHNEARGGVDAKMVLRDAFALDLTLNPDFSQVESDEPQVTVNQRYEVYFPEKRPFFMEKASLFSTPENLFFSRRIVDPQFGARLTGTAGRWSVGLLAADDQAPGAALPVDDPMHGKRALDGVLRGERGFGRQSHVGVLATSYDFGARYNRVGSLDARIRLGGNWTLFGQATASATRGSDGVRRAGPAYYVSLRHNGRHTNLSSTYTDRSPDFRTQLGYITRVDIREWKHTAGYIWRPRASALVSFGPGLTEEVVWNRQGLVRDWSATPYFEFGMRRATYFQIGFMQGFELYRDIGFRKRGAYAAFTTQWYRWLALTAQYSASRGINYYPAQGLPPFPGRSSMFYGALTLHATRRLRFDETYNYSRLEARREWLPDPSIAPGAAFVNHILRSKASYQFTREFSLRAIVDYNAVLANPSMVATERSKKAGVDILFTYLLHPGTAVYIGYSNTRENLAFNPALSPAVWRTSGPETTTGRQFFVKLSYLLRY